MVLFAFEPTRDEVRHEECTSDEQQVGIMTNIHKSTDVFFEYRVEKIILPQARELFLSSMEFTSIEAPLLETLICANTSYEMDWHRESRIRTSQFPNLKKIVLIGCCWFDIDVESLSDISTHHEHDNARIKLMTIHGTTMIHAKASQTNLKHKTKKPSEMLKKMNDMISTNDFITHKNINLDLLFQMSSYQ